MQIKIPTTTTTVAFTLATPHPSWSGSITRETTPSRAALSSCPSPYGTYYYVLRPTSSPDGILSACEVTVKRTLVRTSTSGDESGAVEGEKGASVREVTAYGIASVFTAPTDRGKGLAGYLLRCVQREADGGLGWWKDGMSAQVVLALEEGFDVGMGEGRSRSLLRGMRDGYVAGGMRDGKEVVNRGARTAERSSWRNAKGLLRAALAKARDWGLPSVTVWSPLGEACVAAATRLWRELGDKLKAVFEERRDGSIPNLRWKHGKDTSSVVWEDKEYFHGAESNLKLFLGGLLNGNLGHG
ncbi:hypothetical protein B0T14DRAFT_553342 [Immersiella caudata]|uniref:LYC1 C-terminal domain-containing protein n=1 Tax=Immersiella caudata TaxID=314043 RepID=A0AA39WWT3_9PEZI|nr:hypothetical protein B0T14DRAFT_553342 [Immersiella caudata]